MVVQRNGRAARKDEDHQLTFWTAPYDLGPNRSGIRRLRASIAWYLQRQREAAKKTRRGQRRAPIEVWRDGAFGVHWRDDDEEGSSSGRFSRRLLVTRRRLVKAMTRHACR